MKIKKSGTQFPLICWLIRCSIGFVSGLSESVCVRLLFPFRITGFCQKQAKVMSVLDAASFTLFQTHKKARLACNRTDNDMHIQLAVAFLAQHMRHPLLIRNAEDALLSPDPCTRVFPHKKRPGRQ
jgi:hypothetical protein